MNPPPTCRWCRVTQRAPAKPHHFFPLLQQSMLLTPFSELCGHINCGNCIQLNLAAPTQPHTGNSITTLASRRDPTTSPRPCDASSWVSQVTHRPKTHRVATASSLPHWPTELGTSSSEQQCNTAAFGQLTQHLCIVFIVHLDYFLRCQSIGVQICRLHLKGD